MVVLAVTWMAKAGRESEVAELFAKLTEESRKEQGCVMYMVHRHRTEPRRGEEGDEQRAPLRLAQRAELLEQVGRQHARARRALEARRGGTRPCPLTARWGRCYCHR